MGIDVTVTWTSPVTGKEFEMEARIDWQFSTFNFQRLCRMLGLKVDDHSGSFHWHALTMEAFARLPLRDEVARHKSIVARDKAEGPHTFTWGDILSRAPTVCDVSRGDLYVLSKAQRRMHRQRTRWRKGVRRVLSETCFRAPSLIACHIAELASEWSDWEVVLSAS